jgi:hypothetical protein
MSQPFTEPPQRPNLDPYSQARAPHGAGMVVKYAFLLVALALVLRVGFSFSDQLKERREKAEADKKAAAEAKAEAAVSAAQAPADPAASVTTADVNQAEARAKLDWAKARQREVLRLAEQVKRRLDEWRTELGTWEQSIVPLLTNDEGKPLATDPQLIRSFRAVFNQPHVDHARLDEIDESATDLTRSVAEAVDDPSDAYLPNEGVETELRELIAEAQGAAETLRQSRRQVTILLEDAVRKKLKGDRVLQDAIAEQERAEQVELTAEARERLDAARRAAAARVAAAEEEAVRTAGEVEARRILDAAAEAKTQQKAAEEKRRLEEEKQKKIAAMEADMADVKRYLGPFIADGYSQPNGAFNADGADLGPMSWSKLSAVGALKPTQAGMEQLMRCATIGNDRDHTGFPQYVGGDDAWRNTNKEFLRRAQELLTKHAEALVAKGLLAP